MAPLKGRNLESRLLFEIASTADAITIIVMRMQVRAVLVVFSKGGSPKETEP